ncbi:OST-HTH/LOTUS domain protein [compost metagenome]
MPVDFIAKLIDDLSDEDGWIQLGALGQNISKLRPAFDARLYGFRKLSDLVKGQSKRFEIQVRGSSASGGESLYVRNRKAGK